MLARLAALCLCLAIVAGCGSSKSGDRAVERELRQGLADIESVHDRKALQAKLRAVVARLRSERPESDGGRRARARALAGFEAKVASLAAEREFYENDSGQVAEATKDAARADRLRARAQSLLDAAEQALAD